MIFVLDTTAVSALMRPDPAVAARFLSTPSGAIVVPQPVIAEIRYGLARLGRSRRRSSLEAKFDLVLASVARAEWDDEVSSQFGVTKAQLESIGARVDDFDLAIAAHALVLSATVVTDNARHFARIPTLNVESWR